MLYMLETIPLKLFVLALIVRTVLALGQTQPGYMDAAYYYDIAENLASGRGFTENFIWNYLAQPSTLPQPSNAHWMPLTSIVIAPFLWPFGHSYRAAQVPMVLMAAPLVPLTYLLSWRIFRRRRWAITSAVLMLSSSFYLAYWTATDGFALYALIGTGVLVLSSRGCETGWAWGFACGLLIGLAHLTRADGFLLLAPVIVRWWQCGRRPSGLMTLLGGYLLIILPWFLRNWQVFGLPLVGGNTIFMREYDDLFSFEKSLTLDYWLRAGWSNILATQLRALLLNLATLAGALHFVFFPFALVGLWRLREQPPIRGAIIYLIVMLGAMSFVFSLPGPRGSFLHSLSALLPILYVVAPAGLQASIQWIAQRRSSWSPVQAERIFAAAFLLMAVILTAYFFSLNQFGDATQAGWNQRFVAYQSVESFLRSETADAISPIMCINPPAYYYFNQRPAIAIPSDDSQALIHAAQKFGARYFVLEADHPRYLDSLYRFSDADSHFRLRATFADSTGAQVQLYQIVPVR